MIELKEGKPQRIILQLTNQGEPYDGEASFRVVYNYKKKDEKVVFDKTSDVVDGKLTLDFPSFKDNDYIYLIETEEGHTEPDEFHIFRSLLNKEPKESQLNIELDQEFGLNKDVLGEKAQEFFDKNAGRLKQTEKLLEERKREREDGEKSILKALEETKKEHLSQMGEFHLNIQEQIVNLSDEIEEEELERQKGDDAVTSLVKVEVGSLESKINGLEMAYISADKSLEKRLNVKTDKLSSDITNVSKKLEGKIPTGGILDFTVDDEKVAKNILWSSVKITDVLRGLRTNNQGFHYTTDINDSQSSAETTYSSEYIDANFGGSGGAWGSITGTLSDQTDLQTALDAKVDENAAITGATKTKITYDAKGLVTAGADATTADIADSSNKRYVTDANLTVIGNTSGTNTGDQTLSGLGGANTALSNLAAVAINTSLISDTNITDDLGSTSIKRRNAHIQTAYVDTLAISSLKAVFGERFLFINEFSDVLWRADKRFTVTSSYGLATIANLFKGGFENVYTIPVSTTDVININLANQSGVPAGGVTYPEGKFYVHFYYTNNNYSAISARVKAGGVWYALATPVDISTVAADKVLEFTISGANHLTDIELTITTNGSDQVYVTALNYICNRWTAELELPYFDKFALSNSIMGNTAFRTVSQTTSANINADGDWYMGVGGTGGHFGIGTSTPGTYHLNVVGNILGNSIYTNNGEIFGSLGPAYLRAAGTNSIFIGDSGVQDINLGVGGGKVGINQQYPNNKLQVDAASASASSAVVRISGSATGFSGANDAGTAYSIIFDGCAYQTGITQVIGAKIEMAKENTWNYADTPTGTKGALVFYTSAGTPDVPTLTEKMRIMSSGNVRIASLDTDLTAPTTSGTTKMVITDASGQLSFTAIPAGGGMSRTEVTGTSQAGAINTGYIANNAGLVTITLPDTAPVGSILRVVGKGAGGWRIAQNASEQIIRNEGGVDGTDETTIGVTGHIDSTDDYDAVELICITADTTWTVLSSKGIIALT